MPNLNKSELHHVLKERYKFMIVDIQTNDDGIHTIDIEFEPGFREWFLKTQGLKRWSTKRYQKVMSKALSEYIDILEGGAFSYDWGNGKKLHDR